MYSVSEAIARILAPRVDKYFGIMGNGNAWFIDALERLNIGIIPVRHEVGTVAAADAYHRVTNEIAVAQLPMDRGLPTPSRHLWSPLRLVSPFF